MLPLDQANSFSLVEVLVCGGANEAAFLDPDARYPASQTCGQIDVGAKQPEWVMEDMPVRRTMGDMVNLPDGDVLIINGADKGSQGNRFTVLAAASIPRVYHSTANLLSDGRDLVAGSNTHAYYELNGLFPTELRVEAYSPAYLAANKNNIRPMYAYASGSIRYGRTFTMTFMVERLQGAFEVNMLSAPFATHSYSMGQRMLKLKVTEAVLDDGGIYSITVTAPPNANVAPPSYYMLFPVQDGVPGRAIWVRMR
ncbi:aldehyde oxidase GLOX [Physcomitrium patens]|uniref:aldehyde oxidase GLOX n=1 Tax=Physcomitrium patens TaxID=3218 RepID=UPI000D15EAB3|nr:aldehyde oxidase GLOX-like [Physcomitrium patens]|eukprot:XP_024365322.1 aldehyde oxidase GLOX-like [Physcomitrella patens]